MSLCSAPEPSAAGQNCCGSEQLQAALSQRQIQLQHLEEQLSQLNAALDSLAARDAYRDSSGAALPHNAQVLQPEDLAALSAEIKEALSGQHYQLHDCSDSALNDGAQVVSCADFFTLRQGMTRLSEDNHRLGQRLEQLQASLTALNERLSRIKLGSHIDAATIDGINRKIDAVAEENIALSNKVIDVQTNLDNAIAEQAGKQNSNNGK